MRHLNPALATNSGFGPGPSSYLELLCVCVCFFWPYCTVPSGGRFTIFKGYCNKTRKGTKSRGSLLCWMDFNCFFFSCRCLLLSLAEADRALIIFYGGVDAITKMCFYDDQVISQPVQSITSRGYQPGPCWSGWWRRGRRRLRRRSDRGDVRGWVRAARNSPFAHHEIYIYILTWGSELDVFSYERYAWYCDLKVWNVVS